MSSYDDYSVRLCGDGQHEAFYCGDGPNVMRLFYRIIRVPSQQEFRVRLMPGANDKERVWVERHLHQIPDTFAQFEYLTRKQRLASGKYAWSLCCGFYIADPIMQLELEMMIDEGREQLV